MAPFGLSLSRYQFNRAVVSGSFKRTELDYISVGELGTLVEKSKLYVVGRRFWVCVYLRVGVSPAKAA